MTAAQATASEAPAGTDKVGRLGIFSWVLYDWAAQPFYALVTTFLFAPYFANTFVGDPVRGQAYWGYAAAVAGILIAISSPVLGAFADASGRRKPWVVFSSLFLVAGMAALWLAKPGAQNLMLLILAGYVLAAVAAELNTVFLNAIMPRLVSPERLGRLSGIGAATGYAGGLAALVLWVGFLAGDFATGKTLFGLEPLLSLDGATREADRLVGPYSSLWFLVFVLPFFFFTPDPRTSAETSGAVKRGLSSLIGTIKELPRHGNVMTFLIARMIFVDGLSAIFAFGGIYGASLFGWQAFELGMFGIILTVAAMLGAAAGGFVEDRIGAKAVIMLSLVIAIMATVGILSVTRDSVLFYLTVAPKAPGASLFSTAGEVWFLVFAVLVGMVAGPLNASSRSLLARLAPPDKLTQFFGLFAFSGKLTSFFAPLAIGFMTQATGNQRLGVAVVLVFLYHGLILMPFVRSSRQPAALSA